MYLVAYWQMPKTKLNVVSVYVFRLTPQGPHYLALRRRKEIDRLGGTWQAIHGGIEAGETATQAAARELWEETGLKPVSFWSLNLVETFFVYQEDAVVFAPCFGAEVDGEVQLGSEHDQHEWMTLEEIKKRLIWPNQRIAVQTLHDEIAQRLYEKKPCNPLMRIEPEFYQKTT